MTDVLCFGDSNTWGYNPKDGSRFPWGVRWTSVLQELLKDQGIRVIEEGLCGRTAVFEDPLRQGRKGVELFPTLLETHGQPDQIVLMLGTNDLQPKMHKTPFTREHLADGLIHLIKLIRSLPECGAGNQPAKILVVAPPPIKMVK